MNYNSEFLRRIPGLVDMRGKLPVHATKKWLGRDPAALVGVVYHQSLDSGDSLFGLAKYHVGPNHISSTGLPGLSYTMFVGRDGVPRLANNVEDKTYSQGDADKPGDENAEFLAVCFSGNFSGAGYVGSQTLNEAQGITAHSLWEQLRDILNFGNDRLFGHYDFGKPACPGNELQAIIEVYNNLSESELAIPLATVTDRQASLKKLGCYQGPLGCEWGPECRLGLTEFQKTVGLVPDGVWNKRLAIAIRKALGAKA